MGQRKLLLHLSSNIGPGHHSGSPIGQFSMQPAWVFLYIKCINLKRLKSLKKWMNKQEELLLRK